MSDAAPSVTGSLVTALAVGLAVGVLTRIGQGVLPDAIASLANSAAPWAVPAWWCGRRAGTVLVAVVTSILALCAADIGYALAHAVGGGSNSDRTIAFWFVAGILAGVPLGVAAAWSTRPGRAGVTGTAVIGGVMLGEGVAALVTIADTTEPVYWVVELAIGAAVVVAATHRHGHRAAAGSAAAATGLVILAAAIIVV